MRYRVQLADYRCFKMVVDTMNTVARLVNTSARLGSKVIHLHPNFQCHDCRSPFSSATGPRGNGGVSPILHSSNKDGVKNDTNSCPVQQLTFTFVFVQNRWTRSFSLSIHLLLEIQRNAFEMNCSTLSCLLHSVLM